MFAFLKDRQAMMSHLELITVIPRQLVISFSRFKMHTPTKFKPSKRLNQNNGSGHDRIKNIRITKERVIIVRFFIRVLEKIIRFFIKLHFNLFRRTNRNSDALCIGTICKDQFTNF